MNNLSDRILDFILSRQITIILAKLNYDFAQKQDFIEFYKILHNRAAKYGKTKPQ